MRTYPLTSAVTFATAALSALVGLASCDAVQPTPSCRVRPAPYAARYALDGTPSGMCNGKILTGELVHLNYFRDKADYAEGSPSVGITPDSVAHVIGEDPVPSGSVDYSLGQFTTPRPGDDDQCKAPTLSETKVMKDMANLSYKWSDFGVVVAPLSAAIYFGAKLERKDGDCTAKYKVSAIYPATYCGDGKKIVKDEMGNDVEEPDPTTGKPNEDACKPVQGSGLYPDIDYKCDASADGTSGTRLCLPVQDFPATKR